MIRLFYLREEVRELWVDVRGIMCRGLVILKRLLLMINLREISFGVWSEDSSGRIF